MHHLPSLSPKKIIKILEKAGFVIDHYRGSHAYLESKERGSRTHVAIHGEDVSRALLKTILKQAKISVEEFLELL